MRARRRLVALLGIAIAALVGCELPEPESVPPTAASPATSSAPPPTGASPVALAPVALAPVALAPVALAPVAGEGRAVDLGPGEERIVTVELAADRYLELAVEQRGIDVAARLEDPAGERIVVSDRPIDAQGEELLLAVTARAGAHRVVLRAPAAASASGSVRVVLRRLGPADDAARQRAAAARDFAAGEEASWEGRDEAARQLHAAALAAWRRLGDRAWEAETHERLGRLAARRQEWSVAAEHHAAAARLFAALGDDRWQAMTLHHLGVDRYFEGRVTEAIELYRRALPLRRRAGDRRGEAITHHVLAQAYQVQDELQLALDHYTRSLALLDPVADAAARARSLHNLGVFHATLGRDADARRAFAAAERAFRDLGDDVWRGATLNQLGELSEESGDLAAALEIYEQALHLRRRAADRRGESSSLVHLARVRQARGETDAARTLAAEARRLAEELDRPRELAKALLQVGQLDLEAADPQRAAASFARAATLYGAAGDVTGEAESHDAHATALRQAGDLAAAQAAGERALDLDESVRPRALGPALRADYFATVQRHFDRHLALQAELHRRAPGEEYAAAALEVSERARARSLLDLLEDRAAQPASFAELRREVTRDGTLLLDYRLGERESHLWILSADRLELVALPPREVVAAAVERAYGLLPRSHRRETAVATRQALCRLSRLLLAPAAAELRDRRLAIVADGPLHYLPFAALPDPRAADCATAPPLVERHELVSLPSASALVALRRGHDDRVAPEGILVVVADPVFGVDDPRVAAPATPASTTTPGASTDAEPPLRRLERSRREAEELLELAHRAGADPRRTLLATGFDARRERVLDGLLGGFRYVHLATHGVVDPRHPERTGVVLSRVDRLGRPLPALLRPTDVAALDLDAELVVLSACESALGEEVRGEGLVGFSQSFLDAGAAALAVSLWPVSDQMTAELMALFYRGLLLEELSPAAALRAAQRELRRRPRREAEYAWAGFVLVGDGWR